MDKIKAVPEGREGIYTVDKQDMVEWLITYPESQIHNFIPTGSMMLGADWDKESVIKEVEQADRIAVLTGGARRHNLNHSLAVITKNVLRVFDIGEITDQDIVTS